ncbi:ent-kaurene synthase TSP4, chloroplastic isoform X2 [Diospyros lotus]|uniref:ent-kaurene synthase TSP4, chloroplastic isoform X2 n=1 Tax=Diospyros lotus TaxID=55363 RepID=UPI0022581EAD|nr:ent-kaurene synthase TSP4, chloroplastic isoform X2 [Diospyros lotus]
MMSLLLPSDGNSSSSRHRLPIPCYSSLSGFCDPGIKVTTGANTVSLCYEETKERIRKLFDKVQLSVSSYDTAWVALVPSPNFSDTPCFPECIDWLLNNQLSDGSWGLPNHNPLLIKDALSSTLASVLALKRWCVGEEQINKGLHFIELNATSAADENQHSPTGFDIIFPGMLEYAKDLGLNLPFESKDLNLMLERRELDVKRSRSEGRTAYLAYMSEGIGKLQDWDMAMKYQRKNGSLFNSPSTTAAAFLHLHNADCLNYLHMLLEKFGNAVPTVYPLDIYARLCMIDSLERLGIDRYFRQEIRSVLDETYSWLQGEEQIFLDTATCAMAFRILRLNGYNVSSDPLTKITKGEHVNFPSGHLGDIGGVLELYRASQIMIHPDESTLEKELSWSTHFLKEKSYNHRINSDIVNEYVIQEVDDALHYPFHANLDRVANRRNIKHYDIDGSSILKTLYCSTNIRNEDFLKLAVEDFNICQSIHREELEVLERWVVDNRLDKLKFARQKSAYCYFSAAAALFSPELSDSRMSWAKNGVLTTVVDDFFDIGGSIEELENLIQLVEKWDVDMAVDCCSEHVQIIFSALHITICEIGAKAFQFQGRSVTSHMIDIWLNLLRSMLKEAIWIRDKTVPTMYEYMTNSFVSFALGPIVLPALYFVGPILSMEAVSSHEYQNLFKLVSTCGRLLNDIHGFERESRQGKLNAVSLHMAHGCGAITTEESIGEVKTSIIYQRKQLLRLVLQEKGSLIPRACKDLFWKMSQVLHLFYMKDDGFTSHEMINSVKAIIHEPIPSLNCRAGGKAAVETSSFLTAG